MLKNRLPLSLMILSLTGCADFSSGAGAGWALQWPFAATSAGGQPAYGDPGSAGAPDGRYADFNFDWLLSGDPHIMPLQVFDDGLSMWLQFPPNGAWPAVFEVASTGWRPVTPRVEGPYMVLGHVYPHLALRGGHLHGEIKRKPSASMPVTAFATEIDPGPPDHGGEKPRPGAPTGRLSISARTGQHASTPPTPQHTNVVPMPIPIPGVSAGVSSSMAGSAATARAKTSTGEIAPARAAVSAAAAFPARASTSVVATSSARETTSENATAKVATPMPTSYLGQPVGRYSVSPADITMRQALERWSRMAGWSFSSEHWDVDVDIPLVGEASFESDFRSAVRDLLAATEMGDRPLQPCFYSNRVLRVVPYSQACDRRGGNGLSK